MCFAHGVSISWHRGLLGSLDHVPMAQLETSLCGVLHHCIISDRLVQVPGRDPSGHCLQENRLEIEIDIVIGCHWMSLDVIGCHWIG